MDTFTPSDSDLVFRRKERWILLGVLIFDAILFTAVYAMTMAKRGEEGWLVGGVMVLALVMLGVITAWMWTFELRLTPYEIVMRSCFGSRVIQYSNITAVAREQIKGKSPAQFQLRLRTADEQRLTIPDLANADTAVFAELTNRCRNAEVTD